MGDTQYREDAFWRDWRGIQQKTDWSDFQDPKEAGKVDGKVGGVLELPEYKLLLGERGILFLNSVPAPERKRMIDEGMEHDKKMHKESADSIQFVLKCLKQVFEEEDSKYGIFRAEDK